MINYVIGKIAKSIERACRAQLHCNARPKINVLADALDFCSLMKESAADALPYAIPVSSTTVKLYSLHFHYVIQLLPDLFCSS